MEQAEYWKDPLARFFCQDRSRVDQDITSFCVGDIWLYFYREVLIGYAHRERREAVFRELEEPLYNDGFTSQHLLTKDHIAVAVKDTNARPEDIIYYKRTQFTAAAVAAVREEINKENDNGK